MEDVRYIKHELLRLTATASAPCPTRRFKKKCGAKGDRARALIEYLLLLPYLNLVRQKQLATLRVVTPDPPASPGNLEVWFMRHAFSCNNNVPKSPYKYLTETKYDPGLTTQGIVDCILFDRTNLRLDRFETINVCVSTSVRTWQTAAIIFGMSHPLNLFVVPGLTELHTSELSYGNIPAPFETQRAVMTQFARNLAKYGVALHPITVRGYNSDTVVVRLDPVGGASAPAVKSEREVQVNALDPVATFHQVPTARRLVPVDDTRVHGDTWDHSFSKYDPQANVFRGLWRILGPGRERLANNQVYFCVSHSHTMQRALSAVGRTDKELLNVQTSFLDSPVLREALSAKVKLSTHEIERIGSIAGLEHLPVLETPQVVISKQNVWQLKCTGTLSPTEFAFTTVSIYQGFERFTQELGAKYDRNHECDKDTPGFKGLAARFLRFTRKGG